MVKVKVKRAWEIYKTLGFNHPMVKVKEKIVKPCVTFFLCFNHPMVKVKVCVIF